MSSDIRSTRGLLNNCKGLPTCCVVKKGSKCHINKNYFVVRNYYKTLFTRHQSTHQQTQIKGMTKIRLFFSGALALILPQFFTVVKIQREHKGTNSGHYGAGLAE